LKCLTVNELAKSSGVSVRTLRHYHEIGLLEPALIGENGYRYYGRNEALRLRQILFWREVGAPLAQIARTLDRPDFDPVATLAGHRTRLKGEVGRIRRLMRTIDRAIAVLNGVRDMTIDELYQGFSPEKQGEYEEWLKARLGDEAAGGADRARWSEKGPALMAALRPIEAELAALYVGGVAPDDRRTAPALERHRAWVSEGWGRECTPGAYAELADVYEHADFRARYDMLAAGFADWLIAAMRTHAAR